MSDTYAIQLKVRLERIAMIAHAGGLIGFEEQWQALNEIRRLTQPFLGNPLQGQ